MRVIVASNRGPTFSGNSFTKVKGGSGGLSQALLAVAKNYEFTWLSATKSSKTTQTQLPDPYKCIHIGVPIKDSVYENAYSVIANSTLWPIYHHLVDYHNPFSFDREWFSSWDSYLKFNREFAKKIAALAGEDDVVLIQDYHLNTCAKELKAIRNDLKIGYFSHVPFPGFEFFKILPQFVAQEILEGLCGADAIGFHSSRWSKEFLNCCQKFNLKPNKVFVSPLGPDITTLNELASHPKTARELDALNRLATGRKLLVRIDRLDPAKNSIRGFLAFRQALELDKSLVNKVVHVALLNRSRQEIGYYKHYEKHVIKTVAQINSHFSYLKRKPIELIIQDNQYSSIAALMLSDTLFINSIRDGLNLVAKEGIAISKNDTCLILSKQAGAYDELKNYCFAIDPYDVHEQASSIVKAFSLSDSKRRNNFKELKKLVLKRDPSKWFQDLLSKLYKGNQGF